MFEDKVVKMIDECGSPFDGVVVMMEMEIGATIVDDDGRYRLCVIGKKSPQWTPTPEDEEVGSYELTSDTVMEYLKECIQSDTAIEFKEINNISLSMMDVDVGSGASSETCAFNS